MPSPAGVPNFEIEREETMVTRRSVLKGAAASGALVSADLLISATPTPDQIA